MIKQLLTKKLIIKGINGLGPIGRIAPYPMEPMNFWPCPLALMNIDAKIILKKNTIRLEFNNTFEKNHSLGCLGGSIS